MTHKHDMIDHALGLIDRRNSNLAEGRNTRLQIHKLCNLAKLVNEASKYGISTENKVWESVEKLLLEIAKDVKRNSGV